MTTNASLNVQTLNQLCVVHVDFNIWSAQTRLQEGDIKLGNGGEMPPAKLSSPGEKKIYDHNKLSCFHSLKTQCRRFLAHWGLRFMNGYAIPLSKLAYVQQEMDLIVGKFNDERQAFLDNYHVEFDNWLATDPELLKYPDFAASIRNACMPVDVVSKRIGAKYTIYNINAVNYQSAQQLARDMDSLATDLYEEIEAEADAFYEKYINGKSYIQASTKSTLHNLFDKIDGLSFMNASLDPLANLLKQTIDAYDSHTVKKRIEGPFFYQISHVVQICADRDKIHGYADGSVSVDASLFVGAGLDDDSTTSNVSATATPAPLQHSLVSDDDAADAVSTAKSPTPVKVTAAAAKQPASGLSHDLLSDMQSFFESYSETPGANDTQPEAEETPPEEATQVPPTQPQVDVVQEPVTENIEVSAAPASDTSVQPTTPEVAQPVQKMEPKPALAMTSMAELLTDLGAMPQEYDSSFEEEAMPSFVVDEDDDWG